MNENAEVWKARYDALRMAIDNPAYVENAERLVRTAMDMAAASCVSFDETFHALRAAVVNCQTIAAAEGILREAQASKRTTRFRRLMGADSERA